MTAPPQHPPPPTTTTTTSTSTGTGGGAGSGGELEIGVWVEGSQKWISGVSRRTTCHDLIKALLRAQGQRATDAEVINNVIVERWKKVERPLDHEQRILKVSIIILLYVCIYISRHVF